MPRWGRPSGGRRSWPRRPELIQPSRGGVSRRRFWIPIDVAFEVMLIAALAFAWPQPAVRDCLLVALASHAVMRIRSGFGFIPKALAFERADPASVHEGAPCAWAEGAVLAALGQVVMIIGDSGFFPAVAGPPAERLLDASCREKEV